MYVSVKGQEVSHNVLAEAEPGRLLSHSASCPWLSAGKPQTAAAIGWLWERKLLKLDDPVKKYVPAFTGGGKDAITIRHCLTHQAGLRNAISAWTRMPETDLYQTLYDAAVEPGWEVGHSAGYHVASTWYILGEVVRVVSTRPVEQFLKDMVWAPLGMGGTRLTFSETEWAEIEGTRLVQHDTSKSYVIRVGDGPPSSGTEAPLEIAPRSLPQPMSWETSDIWRSARPGSGVRGPIADLARFYEFMIGVWEPQGTPPLSITTRAALTARHRVGVLDQTFRAKVDWGLGFVCESSHYGQGMVPYQFGPHASPRAFGHGGNQSSVGMADPEHGLVVAAVWNGMPGDPRHDKRMRETLAAVYEDLEFA